MVRLWLTRRPMRLPPKAVPKMPATMAPTSGASAMTSRVEAERVWLIVFISP